MSAWSGKRGRWRKKGMEREEGRRPSSPTFLTFYFRIRAFSTSWTRLTRPEAWNRLNLPEQLFKIGGLLGLLWKRQRIYCKQFTFRSCHRKFFVYSWWRSIYSGQKNAATFTKWSLTRGEKQWKTIRPSGQKVVEVAYRRWSFTRVLTIELSRGENVGVLNRWSLMGGSAVAQRGSRCNWKTSLLKGLCHGSPVHFV